MPKTVVRSLLVLVAAFAVACADDRGAPAPGADLTAPLAGPSRDLMTASLDLTGRQLIVFEKMEIDSKTIRKIGRLGGAVVQEYPQIGIVIAEGLDSGALATIRARSAVKAAGMDVEMQWIPNNESFANAERVQADAAVLPAGGPADQTTAFFWALLNWNMRHIRADEAYLTTRNGKNTLVCVLDTGVDPGVFDLVGKVDLGVSASFIPGEPFIEDLNFHGTFVSSLISNNGIGTASVAPKARLCAIKVLSAAGSGSFEGFIQGLLHAQAVGADVANASLGAYVTESFLDDPDLHDLVEALARTILWVRSQGLLVVTSAGNEASDLDHDPFGWLHLPSQIPGAMSVSATGPINQAGFDMLAPYSNFGVSGVDVAAGGGRGGTGNSRDLAWGTCSRFACGADFFVVGATGTSFSAPLVAGAAAVIDGQRKGRRTADELQFCLEQSARQPSGGWFSADYGSGIIDVVEAVKRCAA